MLHVAVGLLSLSNLSYFHTADILSTGLPEYIMHTSEFCHELHSDVKKKKKKKYVWVHVQNC